MFGGSYMSGRLQYQWKSQGAVVLFGAVIAAAALLACSFVTELWQLYVVKEGGGKHPSMHPPGALLPLFLSRVLLLL
jgi:hypothetical protein